MSCSFCAAVAAHGEAPGVALALDRLRDEVTVAMLLEASGSRALADAGVRRRNWARARSVRKQPFRRALDALAHGPLPVALLVEDVYGPPVADPDEMALRGHRVRTLLQHQLRLGTVVRVGHGVYALAGKTEGLRHWTVDDCRRVLADPRVVPAGGLTAQEIADRLDVSVELVRKWVRLLRQQGARLAEQRQPYTGQQRGSGAIKYRILPRSAA